MWLDLHLLAVPRKEQGMHVRGLRESKDGASGIFSVQNVGFQFLHNGAEIKLIGPVGVQTRNSLEISRHRSHNAVKAKVRIIAVYIQHRLKIVLSRKRLGKDLI